MLIAELINSCSNERVAHAALVSIGPAFANDVEHVAEARGLSAEAYAAEQVRSFAARVGEDGWRRLSDAMSGEDMPLLRGFRHIVECAMRRDAPSVVASPGRVAASPPCPPCGCENRV